MLNNEKLTELAQIQKILRVKPVKVIAVSSGKGGVGKSCIALNLAVALAQSHKKVLLLDADLNLPSLDIMTGMRAKFNLRHALQGVCHLNETILEGPAGVQMIPGANDIDFMSRLGSKEHSVLVDSFNELVGEWDYLIIDTSAGVSDALLCFTRSSQEVLLVICSEPASIAAAFAMIKLMHKRNRWPMFRILVNKTQNSLEAQKIFNTLQSLVDQFLYVRLDYMGFVRQDERMLQSLKRQEALMTLYPQSSIAQSFTKLAQIVNEWPIKMRTEGNTQFFIERLII